MASQVRWRKPLGLSPNREPRQHITDYLDFMVLMRDLGGVEWARKRMKVSARAERTINMMRR